MSHPIEYVIHPEASKKATGERVPAAGLAAAMGRAFLHGVDSAIALRSGHPSLTDGVLTEASSLLQKFDVVIGPSTDHSVYLLGLKAKDQAELLEALRGKPSLTLEQIMGLCQRLRLSFWLLETRALGSVDGKPAHPRF